ncbi:MAG: PRC-barrel domain containing protein [Rubrivivax sp.]|nr:MAG: PRC-barrel domain containing protein [Rubrivivax sp.]
MASPQSTPGQSRHGGPGPRLMTAATLEGDKVVNFRHELLGTVHDITLDVDTGRIAHVVVIQEGMFGVAKQFFAIPWEALTLDPVRKCFVLNEEAHLQRHGGPAPTEHV